jgi:hypothetical protein
VQRAAGVLAIAAAVVAVGAATPAVPDPRPLAGSRLGDTGLRLIVADAMPFVLDVDSGRTTRVSGMRDWGGVLHVVGVGGRGGVVVQRATGQVFGVRGGTRVAALGRGVEAWPAADGRSVWIQNPLAPGRCTLRRVGLDGRLLRRDGPFPCATASDPSGGRLGLVVSRTRVVDPESGRTLYRTRRGILAVAGTTLVLAGPGRDVTLFDPTNGSERRLRRPDTLPGIPHAIPAPSGRFVVLEFADPAWEQRGTQVSDLWLLDARNGSLARLPGMPVDLLLKFTDAAWTSDGRVVLLGEDDRGGFVAVWRPGQERLALKRVRLPMRQSGSDSFAVLR